MAKKKPPDAGQIDDVVGMPLPPDRKIQVKLARWPDRPMLRVAHKGIHMHLKTSPRLEDVFEVVIELTPDDKLYLANQLLTTLRRGDTISTVDGVEEFILGYRAYQESVLEDKDKKSAARREAKAKKAQEVEREEEAGDEE